VKLTEKVGRQLLVLGLDPRLTISVARNLRAVLGERKTFRRQHEQSRFQGDFELGTPWYFFADKSDVAGTATGHYFHQDLLVARAIFESSPQRHVDVGSSIYGFVSHVASFRQIDVIDVRPLDSSVPGINFVQMDITDTDAVPPSICDSLSCLHAAEHFGLGRYGDPIDVDGWYKGLLSLRKMLVPGGKLYFSVPTSSRQRIEFNAHRVFSVPFLEKVLSELFEIHDVSFVNDDGNLLRSCNLRDPEFRNAFGCTYGCSIWTLTRQ
jgi:hypothetical protein